MAHSSGSLLWKAFKSLLIAVTGFILLLFAWLLKIAGMILTKLGELIEKAKVKHSS
jgi:hypothetical protein